MTLYCPIGQKMLNLVTKCCKLLTVNQAAEQEVSSTDLWLPLPSDDIMISTYIDLVLLYLLLLFRWDCRIKNLFRAE